MDLRGYQYVSPYRVLAEFEDKLLTGTRKLEKTRQLLTPGGGKLHKKRNDIIGYICFNCESCKYYQNIGKII